MLMYVQRTEIAYIYVETQGSRRMNGLRKKQARNYPTRAFLNSLRLSASFLVAEPLLGVDWRVLSVLAGIDPGTIPN